MRSFSPEYFHRHVQKAHGLSPASGYLRELVYGGSDGIVTTFAVVAGFTGAQHMTGSNALPFITVILFGLANLFADAFSMGLGNLLSSRSQQKVYAQQEKIEKKHLAKHTEFEMEETQYLLTQQGFTPEHAQTLAKIFSTNPTFWLEFMMQHELNMPANNHVSEWITSIVTFFAFVGFGLIPLLPYLLNPEASGLFVSSVISTIGALLLLSIIRWRITKEALWRSVLDVFLITGVSATVAFMVGRAIGT